jgi:hypothetical protein
MIVFSEVMEVQVLGRTDIIEVEEGVLRDRKKNKNVYVVFFSISYQSSSS